MTNTILQTKLHIPPLRPSLVPRPRIIARLNAGRGEAQMGFAGKLTLVSAPAGFGKTTLLSIWVRENKQLIAWISLDRGDNDVARFWQYVGTALQRTVAEDGTGAALKSITFAPPSSSIEHELSALINELTAVPSPITLILDDYHVITNQAIHESLAFLLDHQPPNLHLVIAGRTSPPLPLARLRVRHQLTELTAADLRFTPQETAVFLNQVMGLTISPDDLNALEERTEGWIAALQVAALSLQGHNNATAFIQQFSGSHRHILDYLVEEVLAQQPPALRQFLLYTSILDQLSAPLCDALWETSLSQAMLDRLEQANLFLIPLDDERRWYRYHHLFADFLRGRLQEMEPAIVPELHRRASLWCEENGLPETAVDHALAAQTFDRAIQLIGEFTNSRPAERIGFTLFRWLQQLPVELVRTHPRLSLALAWGYCRSGEYQNSETWIAAAESHRQAVAQTRTGDAQTFQGEIAAVRSIIACYQGNVAAALTQSRAALALLPPENHMLRGLIANNIAMNLGDAISSSGDLAAAAQIYAEVAAAGRAAHDGIVTAFALNRLGQLQISQGVLHRAADTFRQVLALGLRQGERPSIELSLAHFNLAHILYQWNRLDEAQQHLEGGEKGHPIRENALLSGGYVLRVFLAQARGDVVAAQTSLAEAADIGRETNITWVISGVAAARARWALMQGDLETAVRWADTCGLAVGDDIGVHRVGEYATLARIRMAQGERTQALALLAWLLRFVTRLELTGHVLELMVIQALAYQAAGELEEATAVLAAALAQAEPEGYVRLFVDEGTLMPALLRRTAAKGILPGYVGRLLAAFPGVSPSQKPQPLIDPLSDRELEVLRLLADGRSNPEIAAELFLAVGTVKRHVHNILGKLNVANRRQAGQRARELNLLKL